MKMWKGGQGNTLTCLLKKNVFWWNNFQIATSVDKKKARKKPFFFFAKFGEEDHAFKKKNVFGFNIFQWLT